MDYVIGTFTEEDVECRVEPETLAYIEENGLMDAVVSKAVRWLRDWYDDFGDKEYDALRHALGAVVGAGKMRELEGGWE